MSWCRLSKNRAFHSVFPLFRFQFGNYKPPTLTIYLCIYQVNMEFFKWFYVYHNFTCCFYNNLPIFSNLLIVSSIYLIWPFFTFYFSHAPSARGGVSWSRRTENSSKSISLRNCSQFTATEYGNLKLGLSHARPFIDGLQRKLSGFLSTDDKNN